MKVLITGINGFVGTILKKSLEQKGSRIFGIDKTGSDKNILSVDITDISAVDKCLHEIKPDFIFHLAAISLVDFKNPSALYSINVNGTINLLTAAANLQKMPNILFVSSSQVYGIVDDSKQPITEDTVIEPVNHYGASKAAAEHIVQVFSQECGLPSVIVRPFNHIGRGQNIQFAIPKIIKAFKDRNKTLLLGNLSVMRDFLDVRDVVDIYMRLFEDFSPGEIYNISSGKGVLLKDIITMLENMTNHRIDVQVSKDFIRKNEITKAIGDHTKVSTKFNWQPHFSLEETLQWILSGS